MFESGEVGRERSLRRDGVLRYLGNLALNADTSPVSDVLAYLRPDEELRYRPLRRSHPGVREVLQLAGERVPVLVWQVRLGVAGRCIHLLVHVIPGKLDSSHR